MFKILHHIPAFFRNKFLLTATGFMVWMLFFDHNNIFVQLERRGELNDLKDTKHYYEMQVSATQKELDELQSNAASIEKAAREKYLMKKDNEDLYVVAEEKTQ
jgi:cell division protein FtsB